MLEVLGTVVGPDTQVVERPRKTLAPLGLAACISLRIQRRQNQGPGEDVLRPWQQALRSDRVDERFGLV